MNIFILNAGSATLKFAVVRTDGRPEADLVLLDGLVSHAGTPAARLRVGVHGREVPQRLLGALTPAEVAELAILACSDYSIDAAGYRVVHGGTRFTTPAVITPAVCNEIRQLSSLAPLHNPVDLAGIETGLRLLPRVPAVAVFDTAFHATLPAVASTYALPWRASTEWGLRRYGFHGIAHRYVASELLRVLERGAEATRLVTCHLGSGASVCAVRDGRSVDTSMGMTPMEGLVMGTRSGDLDPGLLLYLLGKMTGDRLNDLLNHESGLLGVSGRSADLRDLEGFAGEDEGRCELAMDVFAYRVRKYIGAYSAVLGGIDGLAFSGGIGEWSPRMRTRICSGLDFLGIRVDAARNTAAMPPDAQSISPGGSAVPIWVIPAREELQIARETFRTLRPQ